MIGDGRGADDSSQNPTPLYAIPAEATKYVITSNVIILGRLTMGGGRRTTFSPPEPIYQTRPTRRTRLGKPLLRLWR